MKRFFSLFLLIGFTLVGRADYLHWYVSDSKDTPEFEYAQLRLGSAVGDDVESGTYVVNYFPAFDENGEAIGYDIPPMDAYADIGEEYMAWSFVVDLFNGDGEVTHTSQVYHLQDLKENIHKEEFDASWKYPRAVEVTNFRSVANIPEPSCALLFVVGAMALGVRRSVDNEQRKCAAA